MYATQSNTRPDSRNTLAMSLSVRDRVKLNGYAVLSSLVPGSLIAQFEREISVVCGLSIFGFHSFYAKHPQRNALYKLLQNLTSLRDLASFLAPALKKYFFREEAIVSLSNALIVSIPEDPISNPLHQDVYNYHSAHFVKFWVPLTPVNDYYGSMRIWPGSHLKGVIEPIQDDSRYPAISRSNVDEKDGVILDMKPGSLVAFDPLILHESVPNRSAQTRLTLGIDMQEISAEGLSSKNVARAALISFSREENRRVSRG